MWSGALGRDLYTSYRKFRNVIHTLIFNQSILRPCVLHRRVLHKVGNLDTMTMSITFSGSSTTKIFIGFPVLS